jgi:rhodanese-related sulfurtransferase
MEITTISAQEFAGLCEQGKVTDLIDVRTPAEFRELHLANARNVPLHELDPGALIQARLGLPGEPIYLICRTGDRGRMACKKLLGSDIEKVVNVEGGTLGCLECGLPVVRGKTAISLERQVRIAAGTLVLIGISLAWLIHPAFIGLSAFIGAGLVFAGISNTCGMGLILARMPWNRDGIAGSACAAEKQTAQ